MRIKKCLICISLLLIIPMISSCTLYRYLELSWIYREKDYYSDVNNFVTAEGVVVSISQIETTGSWYITLKDLSSDDFENSRFCILDANVITLQKNGFFDEIKSGDVIEFSAAPENFGDGYVVPIVSISANGKIYLDFETGWNNLMDSYTSLDAYYDR